MSVSVRKLGSNWIVLKSESNLSILRMLFLVPGLRWLTFHIR